MSDDSHIRCILQLKNPACAEFLSEAENSISLVAYCMTFPRGTVTKFQTSV